MRVRQAVRRPRRVQENPSALRSSIVLHEVERAEREAGRSPYLALMDQHGDIFHKMQVGQFSREKIDEFVLDIGFYKKSLSNDPDPEGYQEGARPPPGGTTAEQLKQGTQSKWSSYGQKVEPPVPVEAALPVDKVLDHSWRTRVADFLSDFRKKQQDRSREDL